MRCPEHHRGQESCSETTQANDEWVVEVPQEFDQSNAEENQGRVD